MAAVTAITMSAGCQTPAVLVQPATPGITAKNSAGDVYNDIFNFDPQKADDFKDENEINKAINDMKKRILFSAGPDTAESATSVCENGMAAVFCPINELQRNLQVVRKFSEAVSACYSGERLPDGTPDSSAAGSLDLDCFISRTQKIDIKERKIDPGLACGRIIYDCYKEEYVNLVKHR